VTSAAGGTGGVEMRRVVVVGVTGAGKTTLAAALARALGVPHIEIDAIQWRENWTKAPLDEILAALAQRTAGLGWVADGNYSKLRPTLWPPADTIVWLDYGLLRCLWRVLWRTLRRVHNKELLWGVNRETVRNTLLAKDGLLAWAVQTHGRYRREFEGLMRGEDYAHLRWVRLRTPREARRWLAKIAALGDGAMPGAPA
jgi:adenylate kinase family enzyme